MSDPSRPGLRATRPAGRSGILESALALVPAAGMLLLVIVGIFSLPLSFDEALNLNGPRNLLMWRVYGTRTFGGTVPLDPLIGTGPTVLIPVALAQWTGGIGIVQSRIVAILFFVLFLGAIWRLMRGEAPLPILGSALAFAALVPFRVFEEAARVLGDFPAFAFLGLTAILLVRGLKDDRALLILASGAAASAAVLAKPQAMPVALSAIATIALHHARRTRTTTRPRIVKASILFLLPLLIPLLFWIAVPRLLHPERLATRAALMAQQAFFAGRLIPAHEAVARLWALPSPIVAFCMVAAAFWGVLVGVRGRDDSTTFLALTFLGYLVWWLFMLPTPERRYALYWIWIGSILLGFVGARITAGWSDLSSGLSMTRRARAIRLSIISFSAIFSIWSLSTQYPLILREQAKLQAQKEVLRFVARAAAEQTVRVYGYQWYVPWFISALSAVDVGEFEADWLRSKEEHTAYLVEIPELKGNDFVSELLARAVKQFGSEPTVIGPYTIHRLLSRRWTDRILLCPVENDFLAALSSDDVVSVPTALNDPKGRFRHPLTLGWKVGWERDLNIEPLRPAVAMITEAALLFRGVGWGPENQLLIGVLRPPEYSDGFTLRVRVIAPGEPGEELGKVVVQRELYRNDPFSYFLFPAPDRPRRVVTVSVAISPEPGGGAADWAFLSPVVLVRAPGVTHVRDCLRR